MGSARAVQPDACLPLCAAYRVMLNPLTHGYSSLPDACGSCCKIPHDRVCLVRALFLSGLFMFSLCVPPERCVLMSACARHGCDMLRLKRMLVAPWMHDFLLLWCMHHCTVCMRHSIPWRSIAGFVKELWLSTCAALMHNSGWLSRSAPHSPVCSSVWSHPKVTAVRWLASTRPF